MRVCNVKSYDLLLKVIKIWKKGYKGKILIGFQLENGTQVHVRKGINSTQPDLTLKLNIDNRIHHFKLPFHGSKGIKRISMVDVSGVGNIFLMSGGHMNKYKEFLLRSSSTLHLHDICNYFHNFLEPTEEEQMMFRLEFGHEWVFTKQIFNEILKHLYSFNTKGGEVYL